MSVAKHMRATSTSSRRAACYARVLAILTGLFALRVAGQALQRWAPVASLPTFGEFQGSSLAYTVLLPAQLALLALMAVITWRVALEAQQTNARAGAVLLWAGGMYMAGSLARIAAGLATRADASWFTAWIPSAFHVVLAGFVLTLALYHRAPRLVKHEASQWLR